MAYTYKGNHWDALGRRIPDEVWDYNERLRAKYDAEDAQRAAEEAKENAPLPWGAYLEGLGAEAASGATLGFSNYLPGFRKAADTFVDKYPLTAGVANIAGVLPSLIYTGPERLALGASKLAMRGAETLAPAATAATRKALAGGAGRVIDSVISPALNRSVDKIAAKVVGATPWLSKSTRVLPTMLSSALQSGVTAYNSAIPRDPSPLDSALTAASVGGVLGGALGLGTKAAGTVLNSFLKTNRSNTNNAIQKVLNSSGLSREGFLDRLSQLGNNARVYDANPTTLGAAGLLKDAATSSQALADNVRNTAISDIAKISKDSQELTGRHLGETLPSTYSELETQLNSARGKAAAPLYEAADKTRIDLAAHPDLMDNFVLGNRFADYLAGKRGQVLGNAATTRNIDNFIARRNDILNAGDRAIKSIDTSTLTDDMLNDVHRGAIKRHIAANNVDLSLPRPLVRGYLDELAESLDPQKTTKSISEAFQTLEPDIPNSVDRFINNSKQAIQAVNPADAAAQAEYARMSLPLNQMDWARNLTKGGTQTKLGSEVTDAYIASNNNLRNNLAQAGLPDKSRPLTRYVLDEHINNAAGRDPQAHSQAILDTISREVQPRLESVYGAAPVQSLVKDAANNAQLLENRTNLANLNLGNREADGTLLELLHALSPGAHTAVGTASRFARQLNSGTNNALVDFLQRDPETARAAITDYIKKNPGGDIEGFYKYISALMGRYGELVAKNAYIPTDQLTPKEHREIFGY